MKDGFIKVAAISPDIIVANPIFNAEKIIEATERANAKNVKLAVFPELAISGYTCTDLFFQDTLLQACETALQEIAEATKEFDMLLIIGCPLKSGQKLYNCAVSVFKGSILSVTAKQNMPNYNEFYELRHFAVPTDDDTTISIGGNDYPFGKKLLLRSKNCLNFCVGVEICEDLWVPVPPSSLLAQGGATIIANLSAGDELTGKADFRRNLVSSQSSRLIAGYVYASAGVCESTTDMVFAGHNMIYENGHCLSECAPFGRIEMILSEIDVNRLAFDRMKMNSYATNNDCRVIMFDMENVETELTRTVKRTPFVPSTESGTNERAESILTMQSYGLAKRIKHAHAKSIVLGVSGGSDSTLALIVAAKACDILDLPRSFIHAVTMPCFGTTKRTRSNAEIISNAFGATLHTVDISQAVTQHFVDIQHDADDHNVVYENSQARMRTLVLMNLANKYNGFVVGTGDMSELALGWATYNGDHMSMYGVNASIPKTLIKHLIRYYANETQDACLKEALYDILDTPVSPELLPANDKGEITQITEDNIGPYELHDFFIYYFLRYGMTPSKIFRLAKCAFTDSYDTETIKKWLKVFLRRFCAQQFKRSCMPDGAKVGTVSLSPRGDWRMPSDADFSAWLADIE